MNALQATLLELKKAFSAVVASSPHIAQVEIATNVSYMEPHSLHRQSIEMCHPLDNILGREGGRAGSSFACQKEETQCNGHNGACVAVIY